VKQGKIINDNLFLAIFSSYLTENNKIFFVTLDLQYYKVYLL
jgi:hypothetical protein